ncbi:hypothetical protein GWK47_013131 [Chionoecetes opilio]|uniref:Uncharacterized protein n=1 Tax=Chionoecetes opilio TaxID=41210 RepID=A0A8J5CKT1_CHIOP|nr:hypothetical protein GWK47_013131 [Chionoecetes opilio]
MSQPMKPVSTYGKDTPLSPAKSCFITSLTFNAARDSSTSGSAAFGSSSSSYEPAMKPMAATATNGNGLPRRLGKIGPMRTRHSSRYPSLPSRVHHQPVCNLSRRVYNAVDRVNPHRHARPDRRGKHVPKHAMSLSRKNLVECHVKSFPLCLAIILVLNHLLMRYLDTEMNMKKMFFLYKEWCLTTTRTRSLYYYPTTRSCAGFSSRF